MTDAPLCARPSLPRYDPSRTYDWNYEHAPEPVEVQIPDWPGTWSFCGLPVASPLGIPAGPLLNGRWCRYYASLGFDVLTYKTVRSGYRPCYPLPNLQPVVCGPLAGGETDLPACDRIQGSWAVSFGMPSQAPDVWRADVEWTRQHLPPDKILAVSVVGTIQPGWGIDELAADYARCARWAADSGADVVETNFSCPNVATCDGQLYQHPADAVRVAAAVREVLGRTPLAVKVGRISSAAQAAALGAALAPYADALSMTNSIAATVMGSDGQRLFDGQPRGICGAAIRQSSVSQTRMFADWIRASSSRLRLIGGGGAGQWEHVLAYLDAGAHAVHVATAAMLDPAAALEIRREAGGRVP